MVILNVWIIDLRSLGGNHRLLIEIWFIIWIHVWLTSIKLKQAKNFSIKYRKKHLHEVIDCVFEFIYRIDFSFSEK